MSQLSASMTTLIWYGDEAVSHWAADDRGIAYGDGLFETLRVEAGRGVLLAEHLQRLQHGCLQLGIPFLASWPQRIADALASGKTGILRVQVTRGRGGRGYQSPSVIAPGFALSWHERPQYPAQYTQWGIRVADAPFALASQPALAGIKHSNRLEQVLLRDALATQPQCQELVVCNQAGEVVEGVFSNLFMIRAGVLLTPPVTQCGVSGVLREALLADAPLPVEVATLTPLDLLAADEVFFANSVMGIWPVATYRERAWPVGEYTRQCQAHIAPWFAPE